MTVTDDARNDLYQHVKDTMGERRASTLMALLPPVGWADVATKHDLAHQEVVFDFKLEALRLEMRAEFAKVRDEMHTGFAGIRAELHNTLRTLTLVLVGTNITLFGLAVATVGLA